MYNLALLDIIRSIVFYIRKIQKQLVLVRNMNIIALIFIIQDTYTQHTKKHLKELNKYSTQHSKTILRNNRNYKTTGCSSVFHTKGASYLPPTKQILRSTASLLASLEDHPI